MDVNSFSIKEIQTFFNIPDSFTKGDVEKKFLLLVEENDLCDDKEYYSFFYKIKNKLLDLIDEQEANILNRINDPNILQLIEKSNLDELKKKQFLHLTTPLINPEKPLINSIQRKNVRKVISLDSLFREKNDLSSDFTYKFLTTLKNVRSIQLSSIELPNTWYIFSERQGSNYFFIELFNTGNVSYDKKYKIIIPSGNYTATNIIRFLNLYFQENEGLKYLKWRINDETGQLQLMVRIEDNVPLITNEDFSYDIVFVDEGEQYVHYMYNTAGWNLGFREQRYSIFYNDSKLIYDTKTLNTFSFTSNAFIESESYFGSSSNTYLFLEIDDFINQSVHNNHIVSEYGPYTTSTNVLARISLTSGSNTLIINTKNDFIFKRREYHGPVNIDKIRIRLLDKFNKIVDLGDGNFSLSLEIEQQYE